MPECLCHNGRLNSPSFKCNNVENPPNIRNASPESSRTPDDIIEYIFDKKVAIKTAPRELEDLEEAVKDMVQYLVGRVEEKDDLFRSSFIVNTGSFYDGTKICQPDEFDYLVVSNQLSKMVICAERHKVNPGCAHVLLHMDKDIDADVKTLCECNQLVGVQDRGSKHSFRDHFRILFHDVVRESIKCNLSFRKSAGILVLDNFLVSVNGPECTILAEWKSIGTSSEALAVSIDVCPAIQCSDVDHILQSTDCAYPAVFKKMQKEGKFYLIPRKYQSCKFCFKLVFAEADQNLVKELGESMKKSLMITKYLSGKIAATNSFSLKRIFNSFAMKMAALHCEWGNKNESKHSSLAASQEIRNSMDPSLHACLMSLLEQVRNRLEQNVPVMPAIFIRDRNIWRPSQPNSNWQNIVHKSKACLGNVIRYLKELPILEPLGDILENLEEICGNTRCRFN